MKKSGLLAPRKDTFLCLESSAQQLGLEVLAPDVGALLPARPRAWCWRQTGMDEREKAHLAEDDGGIGAVTLRLFPALQHDKGAGLYRCILPQPLTQALPVQGEQCQWHPQGLIPQGKGRAAETRTHKAQPVSTSLVSITYGLGLRGGGGGTLINLG